MEVMTLDSAITKSQLSMCNIMFAFTRIIFVCAIALCMFTPIKSSAISGACSYHEGVDCERGWQSSGKVYCKDGWTESIAEYDYMKLCESNTAVDLISKQLMYDYKLIAATEYRVIYDSTISYYCPLNSKQLFSPRIQTTSNGDKIIYPEICMCDVGYYNFGLDSGYKCVQSEPRMHEQVSLRRTYESGRWTLNGGSINNDFCLRYGSSHVEKGKCECDYGYKWKFNVETKLISCVQRDDIAPSKISPIEEVEQPVQSKLSNAQVCKNAYGENSIWTGGTNDDGKILCDCALGFRFDVQDKCVELDQSRFDPSFPDRIMGKILLQVDSVGEAWYVEPENLYRYYMKDGDTAYAMMRSLGLGITNDDLLLIPMAKDIDEIINSSSYCAKGAVASRTKGKILLQVQEKGEAWYVYPDKCRRIYLKDGAEAYSIMRYLSLGITTNDLYMIPTGYIQ